MSNVKSEYSTTSGFTIVELLIVIIVIAVLATITIVAYNGIQTRARASAASTALSQGKKKLELYKVDNSTYPLTGSLASAGVSNGDTTYQYTSTDGSSYCLTATNGNVSYYIDSTTHTSPTAGGCAGHGQGGVSAITNLAIAPRGTVFSTPDTPTFMNDRYSGSGTYVLLTGQTPPTGTDLTTAVRFTSNSAGQSRGFHISGNPEITQPGSYISRFPVVAGDTYTISCWMRTSQAGLSFYIRTRPAIDATTWYDGGSTGATVSATAGVWIRVSQTYSVPATATALVIYAIVAYPTTVNAGETVDATGLMITRGSTLYNYADGSATNWVWNGVASTSTSTGPPL